ncbi:MAG: hypothetical protein LBN27_02015 [Prevotellaceae bacterium]|jgi:hypothetical protein|nr:hypothetical protein [Prevotellaceae bacterium]
MRRERYPRCLRSPNKSNDKQECCGRFVGLGAQIDVARYHGEAQPCRYADWIN